MEFEQLMGALGREIGLEGFEPDEDGVFTLDVDGMEVSFAGIPEAGRFVVWADVGEPPEEGRERLYRALLDAMYMGQATGGATFAFAPDSDMLQLFRVESEASADLQSLMSLVEGFVNLLEEWRALLSTFAEVAPEAARVEAADAEEDRQIGLGGFIRI